jgi:RNA polymerase sigma-70 factor (ECF subfamily)
MTDGHPPETALMVDHLFRTTAGQMVAWLTRIFGPAHLDLVEEVVQDALVKALQQWPFSGIPDNPSGWLFRVARNGALDALRRSAAFRGKARAIRAELEARTPSGDAAPHSVPGDDELRMVFMCCHPALARESRIALSLKIVAGFSTHEIARALLSAEPAIAQRLVRAKRQIRDMDLDLELPAAEDSGARLESVLEVVYLLFNEGYSAYAGDDLVRLDLCAEALRLGRLVADSPATADPAASALVSLMAFQAARLPARTDDRGELVLLEDQNRALWDRALIAMGFVYLDRSARGPRQTAYHLQAAIAAVHAGSPSAAETSWPRILSLYDELLALTASPVVALNRAVAVWKVHGAAAALRDVPALEPALANYYLLPAIKGRLLAAAGDGRAAVECYRAALERPTSEPVRRFLERQLAAATVP